ncbi:hypothetical protein COO91_02641 [Nostoc flagelliforme CCNUN1]|uniref:DUF4402 domain-containing protein n=1 Tax=Nostoc flagelliforme CCNUN1 TaxID=2038116 RepID=A0A2K8SMT7_9NOSO|nr:hypothetical protein [Nostoc flagelliforme]AUB36718.1 hypothetical protein COO91_02641 [Nostoc flagelliforme CCNUN1]
MKNKIVAIIAASAAALGSTIFSTPAHAQITTPASNVNVSVSVPEVLYLRTVSTIDVDILATELTAATLTASGSGFVGGDQGGTADGTNGVSTTSPFFVASGNVAVTKTVPKVFAVWSNSPRGNGVAVSTAIVTPTLNGANSSAITISSVAPITATANVPGLINPFTDGVTLGLILGGNSISQAGDYTGGVISVTASAP